MREKYGLSLGALGRRLGVGTSYLSLLESGKREKPSKLLVTMICQTYCVRQDWLLQGEGKPFEMEYLNQAAASGKITGCEVPRPITVEERTKELAEKLAIYLMAGKLTPADLAGALVDVLTNPLPLPWLTIEIARLVSAQLQARLPKPNSPGASETKTLNEKLREGSITLPGVLAGVHAMALSYEMLLRDTLAQQNSSRKLLTDSSLKRNVLGMQSEFERLIDRLKRATGERGQKALLAAALKVPPARISEWLSGKKEPGGKTTLKLLCWVQEQDSQPNTLGSADNTTKGKTQVRKSVYEKQTQVRKKG